MKKTFLTVSLGILSTFALIACGSNSDKTSSSGTPQGSTQGGGSTTTNFKPGDNISILNSKSYIFTDAVDFLNTASIPTYKAKDYGDVPYVNVEDLKQLIKSMNDVNVDVKKESSSITLTKTSNENSYVKFDAKNNEISFKNPSLLADSSDNKIGHDYCLTSGQVIKSSALTKVGTVGKDEGKVSLNDYNIKLYEENNIVYVPYDLFNVLLLPSGLEPFMFNGKDFFKDPGAFKKTELTSLCYSGNGYFEYAGFESGEPFIYTYKKIEAKSGHKYTYETVDMNGKALQYGNKYFALYSDGKGAIIDASTNKEVVDGQNRITKIKYVEDKEHLTMYLLSSDEANPMEPSAESYERMLIINLGETRFAKKERSQALADFTYNLLCLSFDKVYSVKEAKNITSFDKYFTDNGYKDNLKSKNIDVYEEAMAKFLNTSIDDGHTTLVALSIFDYQGQTKIVGFNEKYVNAHSRGISNKANEYFSLRWAQHDFNGSIKIVGDTAYLSFDNFVSGYGFPASFRNYSANDDIEDVRNKDTSAYMAICMLRIEAYNNDQSNAVKIKNIVVDITANTGGDMTMLPYVACIMTKDPKLCVGDSRTGQVVEYHYEADFDGDGKYGDTFADKYNFFLFTSDASFSCGSSLPSMLKGTNVKIIGAAGAGGASPITTFTDASGLIYKTSGQFGIFYKDGDTYKTIENGVPVDYAIDKALWYDYENLTKKIDEFASAK